MRLFPSSPDQLNRRWWATTLLINGVLVLVVFALIQLIPVPRDNPPVVREPIWDTMDTHALTVRACFDCHSNETHWPWYATIAPGSWIAWYDVTEGRQALNFSEWDRHLTADYVDPDDPFPPPTLSERIEREINDGTMPPGTYRLFNADARLTEAEKDALIAGLLATVKANQETP